MAGHLYVSPWEVLRAMQSNARDSPLFFWPPVLFMLIAIMCVCIYIFVFIVAPIPREPLPSEKTYITTSPDGSTSSPQLLPNWFDSWSKRCKIADRAEGVTEKLAAKARAKQFIEAADVAMSVVIPAYNEEKRLVGMLEEAVTYLDEVYGRPGINTVETEKDIFKKEKGQTNGNGVVKSTTGAELEAGNFNENGTRRRNLSSKSAKSSSNLISKGYEILLVNDGSTDATVEVALEFSRKHSLHDILRITTLAKNRGKGGAVCHGLRHVGGEYAVFADADGASRFSDLGKLVKGCKEVEDAGGRGVAVGSRAHLVGSEAVVKRSALRNALMHSFHLLLRLLTPPATSRIRDTQCGFKIFSRKSLPFIIPYMHAEGWIFDVEMLMLAESSPCLSDTEGDEEEKDGAVKIREGGIKVSEVPIAWNEVGGSKLNVMWDSLGMAWGLAVLRGAWMLGVYTR